MKNSPFAVFRQHQKVLMVVLTGMAMFAFVFLDAAFQSGGSFPGLLGILLGAGIFWVIGTQTGKPTEYAIAGAIIGAAIGIVGQRMGGPPPAVETSVKDFSTREIRDLVTRRQIANDFVTRAFSHSTMSQFMSPASVQFGFGFPREQIDRDVVVGYLFRKEAKEMGMVVSDESILSYIKELSDNNLTPEAFKQLRRDLNLSESQLFDIMRDELLARRAFQLLAPRLHATPEQYWELYRKLNVRQELDVAAIPVERFMDQVEPPPRDELFAFFNRYKDVFPGQLGPGEPGFRQPRKVNVAYLEADYDTFKDRASPVTDEEIVAYYTKHKETQYRNRPLPTDFDTSPEGTKPSTDAESGPLLPELTPERGAPSDQDATPADTDSSSSEPTSQPSESTDTTPGGKGADQVSDSDDAGSDGAESASADAAAAPKPSENGPVVAPKPGDALPKEHIPLPEYRPLDDTLKAEIRELLLRQRVGAAQTKAVEKAIETLMFGLSDRFKQTEDEAEKQALVPQFADELQRYAQEHDLHYNETGLLSYTELVESQEYPIGLAAEPVAEEIHRVDARPVAKMVFDSRPDQLFEPNIAEDSFTSSRFAYWKVADVDSLVPSFDDEGISEQVLTAYKRLKARELAQKRAEKLVAHVKQAFEADAGKTLAEALLEQTVTGDENGLELTVRPTDSFSWMRQSSAPQTGLASPPPPVLSEPITVPNAGQEFMRIVFDELADGEVGVAPNRDLSVYYVVHVRNRVPKSPATDELFKKRFLEARLFGIGGFFRTPYDYLVGSELQELTSTWSQKLIDKYEVRWN